MNLVNSTKLAAALTTSTDKTGRESVVVVAKGTYGFPARPDRVPELLDEQVPPVTCDTFTGEPGLSAPVYEVDFAPRKARCDVLLLGSCHAPKGEPATRVRVALEFGNLTKTFDVVGPRAYRAGALYRAAGDSEPFTVLPISYDNAYGGVDRPGDDPKTHQWYPLNHAGVGYHPGAAARALDGAPMPNTEEVGHVVSRANGNYRPMAFGVVGRAWQPRARWAGTYDKTWLDEKFPFLPDDFDDRYFQSAPEDQQTDFPRGGEEIVLTNLTPESRTAFRLPRRLSLPVTFLYRNQETKEVPAVVDTVLLEPDLRRFCLVWRASLPLKRDVFELGQILVGIRARAWQRSRKAALRTEGKPHFRSLAELIAAGRAGVAKS